jgi:hypothetical protein
MFSSSGRPYVHAVLYGMFFIHLCKQSSRWKGVFEKHVPCITACTYGLPEDGVIMLTGHPVFYNCRRLQGQENNS